MPRPSQQSSDSPSQFVHKHERSLVPTGSATGLPFTVRRIRRVEGTLLGILGRWDYQEFIPPTFEYLDVLASGLEPEVLENCYKFPDRTTGRILLLRPDVTAQLARMVAMGMLGWEFPLRLCYRTTVFRHEPEHAGRDREIFQVGAELIGVDDVGYDAEVLSLTIECLRGLGLDAFKISLGHVGFFKGLLLETGMSPEGQKRAEHAASRKDLPRLEEILATEKVPKRLGRDIMEALGLFGRDDVLERGRALSLKRPGLTRALDRLRQVYRLLVNAGMGEYLALDLGEFRGFDYYDGIVFDVFAEGVGNELGGGGRYNHLIGRFGKSIPSTGFGFDVDRLFQVLEYGYDGEGSTSPRLLISAPKPYLARLFQLASTLRRKGYRVRQGKVRAAGSDSVDRVLEEAAQHGITAVIILGDASVLPDQVLVFLLTRNRSSRKNPAATKSRTSKQGGGTGLVKIRKPQTVKVQDLDRWMQGTLAKR